MILNYLLILLTVSLPQLVFCQQGWYQLSSGTSNNLRSIIFTEVNTGYAVGFNGTILKTTDGGLNWTSQTVGTVENLYSVHFIEQTGYVVGGTNTSVIFKTTNGGVNWINQSISGNYQLGSVFMTDSVTAHISGYRRILRTTNGGNSWDVQFMDTVIGYPASFSSIFFVDGNTGFITGTNLMHYGGVFSKTTNGGIDWSGPGYTGAPLRSIYFMNSETGYGVITNEYRTIKTTNSGSNWISYSFGINNAPFSIWFTNLTTGYIAGSISNVGKIFKTSNSGINWNLQITPITDVLYSITFIDVNTGYAAGNSGTIFKTTNGGVGIITLSHEIPSEYKLKQNYPNPFNPITKIKFQISKFSNVNLTVFDIRGREIITLVNETLKPGTYETEFNAENYPSGIYFYKLQSQTHKETLKMCLIK